MTCVEIAPGVHRCGTRLVNWYLVEDGGKVTLVDAGLPGYFDQLDPALASIGRSRDDVEALVLTHGDDDHVGFAERLRSESGVPVLVHPDDERITTTKAHKNTEGSLLASMRHPATWGLMRELISNGGGRVPPVESVRTYSDGEVLDVPGRLRVVHAPGHTDGHCVLVSDAAGVVFAGDALCTRNPITGRMGPQILPTALNVSSSRAMASLDRIETLDVAVVAPGHGDPATDGAASAVAAARSAGTS